MENPIKIIKWILSLPAVKALLAVSFIAVVVLWGRISDVEEKSEIKAEKDINRHDNIIAIRDSIIWRKDDNCDAKLASKDAEIKELNNKHSALLERLLKQSQEANQGVRKAEKDVDRAINQTKATQP